MKSFARLAAVALCAIGLTAAGCAPGQPQREPRARSTITSDDMQNPNEAIEVALQKKVPGLLVTRTSDGELAVEIRGGSSFRGADSPPLFILDGQPFHPGPGGALRGINPQNIESISVIRSAEAAMYGSQGAHGVIVITTKRARKTPP